MTFHFRKPDARRHRLVLPAKLASREALFTALAEGVPLPDYFGHNWDALDECLADLSFVDADIVELVHVDVPALPGSELATYVSVLNDAVEATHERDNGPQLEVVFPAAARHMISRALATR